MSDITSDLHNGNGARDAINDTMGQAKKTAQRGYEQARDQIQQAYGAAKTNLREADSFLRDQMRERPMTSAATAVGVGMILGMLLLGRRS